MLTRLIVSLVSFSRRFWWAVILLSIAGTAVMGDYALRTIKINTDIDQLMEADLDWRVREREMAQAFPKNSDLLAIVIDGANPDLAEIAAARLHYALMNKPELFKTVTRPDNSPYFQKFGLLLLDEKELTGILETLIQAQPMLGSLAKDPSLRGLFATMDLALMGIARGEADYKTLEKSFSILGDTIDLNLQGTETMMPWRSMMMSSQPTLRDLRKFIVVQPVLDFASLSPGAKATQAVRDVAKALNLTPDRGVTVRLTGSVALNDEEFASVAEGTGNATIMSIVLVIVLLFLALRSLRLILPILLTLVVGLIATTALAMATIGSLNLISVAFAVMFVGIAVDFGIQFGVRFRDEHHKNPNVGEAMAATARLIASPISLAAASAALGFLAFIPTSYRGVSELGFIAGCGMVIAYILNLTLLPALLAAFKPPAEPEAIGFRWAAPVDAFIETHRKKLLAVTLGVGAGALIVAAFVRFDFDPLNLKNPQTESVATLLDIMKEPQANIYTVEILMPSLDQAKELADKIEKLPEVSHAMTLASFVPDDQDKKLALIHDAKFLLDPSINPESIFYPPTPMETISALGETAAKLRTLGEDKQAALRLARALETVIEKDDVQVLADLRYALLEGMNDYLAKIRLLLNGEKASLDSITSDLRDEWMTADGRAKVKVYPKGDARDHKTLAAFTNAVRTVAPNATGTAISIQESGRTVSTAFAQAGALGVVVISLLGFAVLRRASDVARLIMPLILAGILTMATMVAINLPLNFANIIALPLLLSLGVTYAIYFISYWKDGGIAPLQSSMARAVLFSASTTLVAFGSLSLSSHPGTRGMGVLLTIALIYSLLSTFLVLPVLLGRYPSARIKPLE